MGRLIEGLFVLVVAFALPAQAAEPKAAEKPAAGGEIKAEAQPQASAAVKLETEEQKTFYALGVSMGLSLQQQVNPSPEEMELFKAGLMDGALKRTPQVNVEEYRAKIQQLAQARVAQVAEAEKKASGEFLTKMAKEKGAVKTDSGLIFIKQKAGTGAGPKETDVVKVDYKGTLRDGTVFDSSVERGTPATFRLNAVIPCWREGVQKMQVGGKAKLVCPSSIAYGDRGQPPKIKPGATLVFEVELLEITPAGDLPREGLPPGHP
jgi:FKBP-type peptidyl-prolyl cis-trans isomerase